VIVDHAKLIADRILPEYKDSSDMLRWIQAMVDQADKLEIVYQDIFNARDYTLSTTVGENLDIIGRIVGQSRSVATAGNKFFGFDGFSQSGEYGDLYDSGVGERYRLLTEDTGDNRLLPDAEYRRFIETKINRNHSTPTLEVVINIIKSYFSDTDVIIEDANEVGTMQASIHIRRGLSEGEKALLLQAEAIPRPSGVLYWIYEMPFGGARVLLGTVPSTTPDTPVISIQPINKIVTAPAQVLFESTGTNYTRIQWEYKFPYQDGWSALAGEVLPDLTINPTTLQHNGLALRVVYYNDYWQEISTEVILTVN
jgi:hypothetical protein